MNLASLLSTVAVVLALLLAGTGEISALGSTGSRPQLQPSASSPLYNFTIVNYSSSVDAFPLSYQEWLPLNFSVQRSHSLLVYLPGLGAHEDYPKPGGWADELGHYVTIRGGHGIVARGIVQNASLHGMVVIAINVRQGGGFEVNSPCTGPQEQDVLDAIASVQALYTINGVFLLGFSAGTLGVFNIAAHHPALIRGIAVDSPATDFYQALAYTNFEATLPNNTIFQNFSKTYAPMMCGGNPGNSSVANRLAFSLSSSRFYPQNYSAMRMYVTAGGHDLLLTNNASVWPYLQINSTFINRTCFVTAPEPANCTTPFWLLHRANAGQYLFRYVFEEQAPHILTQLDPQDMFDFFFGRVPAGLFHSTWPPSVVLAGP